MVSQLKVLVEEKGKYAPLRMHFTMVRSENFNIYIYAC
jgi:hypothetical protein